MSLIAAYSLKKPTTVLSLFFLKKSVCTQSTFSHTDAAPCEWVCGILDNHGPRMRQYLCNCHRSENARMAPEPHLHAVEAGRLHSSNQKCLKGRRRTRRSKSWRSGYPRHQRCRQDQTLQRCGICSVHDAVTRNNNVCRLSCLLSAHCI